MNPTALLTCLMVLLASIGRGVQAESATNSSPSVREINLSQARQLDAVRLHDSGHSPDFLVGPGLLADRTGRVVRITAESIRLKPNDPVEFPLITLGSGKDYEALAVSFASAQDIHKALAFIGLHAGQSVNSSQLRFWPKGDRVRMVFHYTEGSGPTLQHRNIPAEQLIMDTRTQQPLPTTGFVFTGSEWLPASEADTNKVYAADAYSPGAIASAYNEPSTVLDVPRRAAQHEVYTFQVPNPTILLPPHQLIEITLEPYFRDNQLHYVDLTLNAQPGPGGTTNIEACLALMDDQKHLLNTNRSVNGMLAALDRISTLQQEPFVTLIPDDQISIVALVKVARLLGSLDNERGIRMEPPLEGHPYFRAFIPDERHRCRSQRPAQASEFHLAETNGVTTGEWVWVDSDWKGDDSDPTYRETRVPVASPEALTAILKAKEDKPVVVLIFAPRTLRYGSLRSFTRPLLKQNMIIYVFPEQ